MGRNWLRRCTLSLSGGSSKTIEGGGDRDLRIVFRIEQGHAQSPGMGSFTIYNPSPKTVSAFKASEFKQISFSAGYNDNVGLIFQGDIKQPIYGHENPVDSYLTIYAADGGNAYQQARVTKTLAAGYTPMDKVQVAVDAMGAHGVTMGINALDLSTPAFPRGIPLIGMARSLMRETVLSAGGLWSVQNGKVMVTSKSLDTGNSGTFTLTAQSGLVGYPTQSLDGIQIRSLLNPALHPLAKVKLDPSQIIAAQKDNNPISQTAPDTNRQLDQTALAAGTYTIYKMTRSGDTRGQDWYDDSMAIGVGGYLSNSANQQGYVLAPQ